MAKSEFSCKLQIRRDADVLADHDEIAVWVNDEEQYRLGRGELKATFNKPGPTRIALKAQASQLLEQTIELPEEHILLLSMQAQRPRGIGRLLGAKDRLRLVEVSRKFLAAYDPGPPRTIVNQIWLGTAASEEMLFAFMAERDAYWSEENEQAEGTDDHIALSAFADAMGEVWYDHDFLEYGFAKAGETLEDKFAQHSWVDQWAPIVRERVDRQVLEAANAFIMMGVDQTPTGTGHQQITNPRDIRGDGLALTYLGEIAHKSH